MIWFEYKILTTSEIFEKITYISIEPLPWIFFIIISIFLIFININYIFPAIVFSIEHIKKENIKQQRKKLLRQITLQKEIEDEIEQSFTHK